MKHCFVHTQVEAEATCPYCAKNYCSACLLLHGPRSVVICRDCFENISGKLRRSIKRRRVYVIVALPITVGCVVLAALAGLAESTGLLYLLLGVSCAGAAVVHVVRMRQFRQRLSFREYPKREDDA